MAKDCQFCLIPLGMFCLLVLIAIGSWQIHIINQGKSKCEKTAFDHHVNGIYLGNGTIRYIEHQQFKFCTTTAQGLLDNQLVDAYVNEQNQCQLVSSNCDSYESKVAGWGVGIAFSIVFFLFGCFYLCTNQ
jgi:hypothetical protein